MEELVKVRHRITGLIETLHRLAYEAQQHAFDLVDGHEGPSAGTPAVAPVPVQAPPASEEGVA